MILLNVYRVKFVLVFRYVIWEDLGIFFLKIFVKLVVFFIYLDFIFMLIYKNSLIKDFLICLFIYDKICKSNKIKLYLEEFLMSFFYWKE